MNLSTKREGKQSLRGAVLYTETPMLSCPLRRGFVLCQAGTMLTFLLQVSSWQPAGAPHCTASVGGRAGRSSQAPSCWMGSWSHGNPSWPYWSQWQSACRPPPRLHPLRVRRGRAMNCNNTAQSLCAFWWKRVRNQSREYPKHPKCLLPRGQVPFNARPWDWVVLRAWTHPCF